MTTQQTRPTKLYLAGPMRGKVLYNFPAFFDAAIKLRDQGHFVFNPADYDMANGFDPTKPLEDQPNGFSLGEVMRLDFEKIMQCEAVVLLPEWEASTGVQAELAVALSIGLPVFEIQTAQNGLPTLVRINLSLDIKVSKAAQKS